MASTVSDVASLWGLAVCVVVLTLGLVYRKQIQGLIERGGVKLRRGDTSFELQPTPELTQALVSRPPSGEEAAPEEDDRARPSNDSAGVLEQAERDVPGEGGDTDSRSPSLGDVIDLLQNGQVEEARQMFGSLDDVRDADEPTRQRQDVLFAFWWYDLHRDPLALSELKTFVEHERLRSLALRLIGITKRDAGLFEEALAILEEAGDAAQTDVDRTDATIAIARCLASMDRTSEAIDRLSDLVGAVAPDEQKLSLFDAIADIYRDTGEWLLRALALEKELEVAPNNASLRFDLGYAYAQAERHDLALLHYSAALGINPDHLAARNNIGVTYEHLDMPCKSVESYRRASGGGNTLAAANLGNRLLNAGFAEQAREVLNEAMGDPDPHPNVSSGLSMIGTRREAEDEQEERMLGEARREREFLRRYATARLIAAETPDLSGEWLSDETRFAVSQTGSAFTASFMEGDRPAQFEGAIVNRSIEIVYSIQEYNVFASPPAWSFKRKGSGWGVISPESNVMDLVLDQPKQRKRLTRSEQ